MYHFSLPISVMLSKNKRYPLNLNHYRNAHYRENNTAKVMFTKKVRPMILGLPLLDKVFLIYTIYPQRMSDINNIASIVDKFFCDVLVSTGRLEDDKATIVSGVLVLFGSIDPKNPRAEVSILPLSENMENDLMKITIDQSEIETAIKNFIAEKVTLRDNQDINVSLAATRGAGGFTAEIDITNAEDADEKPEPKDAEEPASQTLVVSRRGRPRKDAVVDTDIKEEASIGTLVAQDADVTEVEEEPKETAVEAAETFKSSAMEDAEESAKTEEKPSRPSLFSR